MFIYWGWDTAVAVNEESDDPATTPGRAAVISTVLLLLTYALVSVATIAFAGVGDSGIGLGNVDNADDVFAAMGHQVFGGGTVGWIMVHLLAICVLTSAVGVHPDHHPADRADRAVDGRFGAVPESVRPDPPEVPHARWTRPSGWAGVSIVFYVGLDADQREHPRRHHRRRRPDDRVLLRTHRLRVRVVLPQDHVGQAARRPDAGRDPAAGGVLLVARSSCTRAKTYLDPDYGYTSIGGVGGVFLLGVGSLLAGVVLMFVWQSIAPAYFRGETLAKRDATELVLAPAGEGRSAYAAAGLRGVHGDRGGPVQPAPRPGGRGPAHRQDARPRAARTPTRDRQEDGEPPRGAGRTPRPAPPRSSAR